MTNTPASKDPSHGTENAVVEWAYPDAEMAEWLNVTLEELGRMPPEMRRKYEAVKPAMDAVVLYDMGLGPLPDGVFITKSDKRKRWQR